MNVIRDEWTPLFDSLASEMADPHSLLVEVGETVAQCTRENFGETGTNRPTEWKTPLSESYQRKLRRLGDERDYPTLFLTGDLFNSIQTDTPVGYTVTVTASDEKASWHQLGEGNNPARPFFPVVDESNLTPYCEARIFEALDKHFEP